MSKGLEALEKLLEWFESEHIGLGDFVEESNEYKIIKKSLIALEIIKEKNVDIEWLKKSEFLTHYNECVGNSHRPLAQEEYDLLKEVLL